MRLEIVIEYSVFCDNCGFRDQTMLKKAKTHFKKQGWITINHDTFCHECAASLETIKRNKSK